MSVSSVSCLRRCDWCFLLFQAWLNEKFSPELLENKSEVVECVMEQLTHMVNSQGNTSGAYTKCQHADDAELEMVPATISTLKYRWKVSDLLLTTFNVANFCFSFVKRKIHYVALNR